MSKARSILEAIRKKQREQEWKQRVLGVEEPNYNEFDIPDCPISCDDWQEFKRKFVLEYGGEPVQPTGMTHSEYLHYIKTSGEREGYNDKIPSLIQIIKNMDDNNLS
jgi:hypothetical protein